MHRSELVRAVRVGRHLCDRAIPSKVLTEGAVRPVKRRMESDRRCINNQILCGGGGWMCGVATSYFRLSSSTRV